MRKSLRLPATLRCSDESSLNHTRESDAVCNHFIPCEREWNDLHSHDAVFHERIARPSSP